MPIASLWAKIAVHASTSSIRKQKIEGAEADLVRVEIKAGAVSERHAHAHEQFVQVIVGAGTLETVDGRHQFSAGSVFHFPAETWHAATCDEDTVLVETNLKRRRAD